MDTQDVSVRPEHLALITAILELPSGQRLPCWDDPDLWFSTEPFEQLAAMAGCRACPVRPQCYAAADAAGERFGIWGGQPFPAHTTPQLAP
ncbi:WhiB family transcriptional regulator [Streptomyces sp. NPDC101213]|uniref:WhiB family transcriptional regulator n=1 Tax=Streptomyces sp. NPDC101213 TaxID=3366130 RepID=UPI00380FEADB